MKRSELYGAGGALALLAGWWVYRDYRAWRALGSGGVPGNFKGWLRVTRWRLRQRNPLNLEALRQLRGSDGDVASLDALPLRSTLRPHVAPHPVPHRQLDQRIHPHIATALQAAFDRAVADNSEIVHYALSHFEKHTQAITRIAQDSVDPIHGMSHGEIAHIHDLDGSMHMILSPTDAILAVEAGWAELHGLAGKVMGLPMTYLLVYAPQSDADVAVAEQLVRAAIAYVTAWDHAEA